MINVTLQNERFENQIEERVSINLEPYLVSMAVPQHGIFSLHITDGHPLLTLMT